MTAAARDAARVSRLRTGAPRDLDALLALENRVFTSDLLSRRSFRNFLASPCACLIVADRGGDFVGYALVLFRRRSRVARLYSIAVVPELGRRGIGAALLAAAEASAVARGCDVMRLEVQDRNAAAIARYEKSGYRLFGRHRAYYDDGRDALRFDKILSSPKHPPAGADPSA